MKPWDKLHFEYPDEVPTMISGEERRYLYWLGASWWNRRGHLVEMGPWLGGSTICLAAGMSQRKDVKPWSLHVYDSFVWREFMAERHPLGIQPGDSFQSFFLQNLREYLDLLRVNRAVLPDELVEGDSMAEDRGEFTTSIEPVRWTDEDPIEILFVDGAKSWTGFRTLLRTFGPALIESESLLVLQDFKYWGDFWVPAIAEILTPSLALEHNLRHNTVAFRVIAPLDESAVQRIPRWDDVTGADCDRLLRAAARRLEQNGDSKGAAIVRLSRVRMWVHKGDTLRAIDCFKESEREWPLTASDANLTVVRSWLHEQKGVELPPSFKTRTRDRLFRLRRAVRPLVSRLRSVGT